MEDSCSSDRARSVKENWTLRMNCSSDSTWRSEVNCEVNREVNHEVSILTRQCKDGVVTLQTDI